MFKVISNLLKFEYLKYLLIGLLIGGGFVGMPQSLHAEIVFKQKDFTAEQETYTELYERVPELAEIDLEQKIGETFDLLPMYSNIIINVKVPAEILDNMFSDLVYTVEKGKKYSKTKYVIDKQNERWYKISDPPSTDGQVFIIYKNKEEHRYVFFVEGIYKTFTTLNGKMIVDVSFRNIENTQYFNVKAYVVITNKFLWRMARFFSTFPSFRRKIEKIVEQNITYVVKVGRHTALSINKYEYRRGSKK